jgi:hypothetical protein
MTRTVEGTAAVEALVERARRDDREALAGRCDRGQKLPSTAV